MVRPSDPLQRPRRRRQQQQQHHHHHHRQAGRGRWLGAAVAVAGLVVAGLVAPAPAPAGAAATDSDALVWIPSRTETYSVMRNGTISTFDRPPSARSFEGDLSGAPGTDVFLYNPGSGADGVLHIEPSGTGVTTSFTPKTVNGTYTPLVGDFDGNAIDDVFWYGYGPAPDALWLFDPSGAHISQPMSVSGDYQPVVIEANGDGYDDILWYRPGYYGPNPDFLWRFGPGASHASRALRIDGHYRVVAGTFGLRPEGSPQQRLVFFSPSGFDHIWTFDTGMNHTSEVLPAIDGDLRPIVGRFTGGPTDDILWYGAGTIPESFWSFTDGGQVEQLEPLPVYGTYGSPAVGDLDGNGYQDIAWHNMDVTHIWSFHDGGYTPSAIAGAVGNVPTVRVGYTDPFDLG